MTVAEALASVEARRRLRSAQSGGFLELHSITLPSHPAHLGQVEENRFTAVRATLIQVLRAFAIKPLIAHQAFASIVHLSH